MTSRKMCVFDGSVQSSVRDRSADLTSPRFQGIKAEISHLK